MSATDKTYFKGSINIPFDNLNTQDFQKDYIDVYEEELLVLILGRDLYNDYVAGLDADPVLQKWKDLRDGKEYTVTEDGRTITVKWAGLKNTKKISLLSFYIYTKWMSSNYQQTTALGVSSSSKENARDVDVREKLVNAYKSCVALVGGYPYKSDNELNVLYPDDIDEDLLRKFDPSLFNFLYYNLSNYSNWIFHFPDIYNVNMFDL